MEGRVYGGLLALTLQFVGDSNNQLVTDSLPRDYLLLLCCCFCCFCCYHVIRYHVPMHHVTMIPHTMAHLPKSANEASF